MANRGKIHDSFKPLSNTGKRKSIFEPSKFPEPSPNNTPSNETTDISGYRQPQSGEMMMNVMDSASNTKSLSPPSYLTRKPLAIQKRQERESKIAPVNPFKAPPRISLPTGGVVQTKLTIGEPNDRYEQEADRVAARVVQHINRPTPVTKAPGEVVQEKEEGLRMKPMPAITEQETMADDGELRMKPMLQRREAIGGGEASTGLESSINSAKGGGQALDKGLQSSMGAAMNADFSGVRVHTDSNADQLNQSIQAKAFTTGQDLFFKKGEYNPGSRDGQELIAHELTHVVQQNKANKADSNIVEGEAIGEGTIQRAIGVEIETTNDVAAYDKFTIRENHGGKNEKYERIEDEHRPLYRGNGWRLETELSGKLEFIVDPPVDTVDELVDKVNQCASLANKIKDANAQEEPVKGKEAPPKPAMLINGEQLQLIDSNVYISQDPSGNMTGGFQATVGIDMRYLPDLMIAQKDILNDKAEELNDEAKKLVPDSKVLLADKKQFADKQEDQWSHKKALGLKYDDRDESEEMKGLKRLIYYYLLRGAEPSKKKNALKRKSFPKGLTQIMARTDFAQMFSMTPEAKDWTNHETKDWNKLVEEWAVKICKDLQLEPEGRVFEQTFSGNHIFNEPFNQKLDVEIGTTRKQWLIEMCGTDDKMGKDLLTKDNNESKDAGEIIKTMGGLGHIVDQLEDDKQGVIMELRQLDSILIKVSEWGKFARDIAEKVSTTNMPQLWTRL